VMDMSGAMARENRHQQNFRYHSSLASCFGGYRANSILSQYSTLCTFYLQYCFVYGTSQVPAPPRSEALQSAALLLSVKEGRKPYLRENKDYTKERNVKRRIPGRCRNKYCMVMALVNYYAIGGSNVDRRERLIGG